jgi:hypothetical protein
MGNDTASNFSRYRHYSHDTFSSLVSADTTDMLKRGRRCGIAQKSDLIPLANQMGCATFVYLYVQAGSGFSIRLAFDTLECRGSIPGSDCPVIESTLKMTRGSVGCVRRRHTIELSPSAAFTT